MRRVQQMLSVLALLLALSPNVFAQNADDFKHRDAMVKDALAHGYFPYQLPGNNPVIRYEELKCSFPGLTRTKILTGDLISELWDGQHDKCTAKGLLSISERLWRRTALVLEISDKDSGTRKEIGDLLESGNYMTRDLASGSREATTKMASGSVEPGRPTDGPFEPIGFTLHAIVLQPVTLHSGPYSTEARSVAFTTFFSFDDGHDAAPCVNPFAMFAEKEEVVAPPVTQTAAATAPAEGVILPNQNAAPVESEHHVEHGHGHKWVIPVLIGVGVGAALAFREVNMKQEVIVNNNISGSSTPACNPATDKCSAPLLPRPPDATSPVAMPQPASTPRAMALRFKVSF